MPGKGRRETMKFFGKKLNVYFVVSWKFLVILFVAAAIIGFFRLSSEFTSFIKTLFSIVCFACMGIAGWSAVRNHNFSLKQVIFMGFLLSFGIHWMLPIFHTAVEVMYLLLINTLVYSAIVFCGGLLAKVLKNKI